MYKLIVEEAGTGQRSLSMTPCRISALSSADYCLGRRKETGRGRFIWTGTAGSIRRLFEAERLCASFLDTMEEGKEYTVRFLSPLPACA